MLLGLDLRTESGLPESAFALIGTRSRLVA